MTPAEFQAQDKAWAIPSTARFSTRKVMEHALKFFTKHALLHTGGCKVFYTPEEWKARGEEYGCESLAILAHDGGDHARAMNWSYEDYKTIESFNRHLEAEGLRLEQCTGWYSAIYERKSP